MAHDDQVIVIGDNAVRISELINRLQGYLNDHGDLPVYLHDGSAESALDASRVRVSEAVSWTVHPEDRRRGDRVTGTFSMPKRLVIPTD